MIFLSLEKKINIELNNYQLNLLSLVYKNLKITHIIKKII